MTKPAAVGMQIIGAIIVFLAFGMGNWFVGIIGVAMFVWGGYETRQKIKQPENKEEQPQESGWRF